MQTEKVTFWSHRAHQQSHTHMLLVRRCIWHLHMGLQARIPGFDLKMFTEKHPMSILIILDITGLHCLLNIRRGGTALAVAVTTAVHKLGLKCCEQSCVVRYDHSTGHFR